MFRRVDAITVPVPDLDTGLRFYAELLGHRVKWRNDAVGQAGLELPDGDSELVLTTRQSYEPNWLVDSVDDAAGFLAGHGCDLVAAPFDIPVGRAAVVRDPFGNNLVLVDLSKGTYPARHPATGPSGRPESGTRDLAVSRMRPPTGEDARGMAGRDEFLVWVETTLYDAELALHNGDAGPRRAIWSGSEPVTVCGAWRNAYGHRDVDELFSLLERSFSDCTSYGFELRAYDVLGDMAFTVGLEHTSVSVDGAPRTYTLRATQVYRREGGEWKVAHRHADPLST